MTDEEVAKLISTIELKAMYYGADEMWGKALQLIEELQAENAALRERLEKAVELPCIEIKKHTSPKVIYNLIYRNELGNITVYEYPAFMQSVAFAHLAELKGGKE